MPKTMETPKCRAQHYNLWMIEPSWFTGAVAQVKSGAIKAMDSDGGDDSYRPYTVEDGVATIDMNGPLMKGWSKYGGTSTVDTRTAIRKAVKDESVKAILLLVDSPGGTVAGTSELAADVRAANGIKPVFAHVEDLCASAAFWISAQATAIYAIPTAEVGSIGTVMQLEDTSGAYAKEGIVVHTLSTGAYKGAGFDGSEITAEQLTYFQKRVDDLNKHFLNGVKAGRSLTMEQVRKVADGRVFGAAEAQELGLIDGVGNIDNTKKQIGKALKARAVEEAKALLGVHHKGKGEGEQEAAVTKSLTFKEWSKAAVRQRYGLTDDVPVEFAACELAIVPKAAPTPGTTVDEYVQTARITTDDLDRDGEVLIPQGMDATDFQKVGAIFWNHNYDLPVATPGKLARSARYVDNEFTFAHRPADYVGEWHPDFVRAMVEQKVVKGVSVGFIPVESRKPTAKDRETYGDGVKKIYSKWKILEWSFAPVQSNVGAVVLGAVKKGFVTAQAALEMFEDDLTSEEAKAIETATPDTKAPVAPPEPGAGPVLPVLPPQEPKKVVIDPQNPESGPTAPPLVVETKARKVVIVVSEPPAAKPKRINIVEIAAAATAKAKGRPFQK